MLINEATKDPFFVFEKQKRQFSVNINQTPFVKLTQPLKYVHNRRAQKTRAQKDHPKICAQKIKPKLFFSEERNNGRKPQKLGCV